MLHVINEIATTKHQNCRDNVNNNCNHFLLWQLFFIINIFHRKLWFIDILNFYFHLLIIFIYKASLGLGWSIVFVRLGFCVLLIWMARFSSLYVIQLNIFIFIIFVFDLNISMVCFLFFTFFRLEINVLFLLLVWHYFLNY